MGSRGEKLPLLSKAKRNSSILYYSTTCASVLILLLLIVLHGRSETFSAWVLDPLPFYPIKSPHHTKQQNNQLRLRSIHHRGTTGEEEVHKRLDITQDFIKTHALHTLGQDTMPDDWPQKYKDVSPWTVELPYKTNQMTLKRLANRDPEFIESYLNYARESGSEEVSKVNLDWNDDDIIAPNITDKDTIISLALMSSNAYVEIPETGDWRDIGWNKSSGHGWNGTGIRGHIFVSDDNSTVVIAYKGTSASYLGNSGDDATAIEDKNNDNLLFSCCCARVSYIWTTVCDCYTKSYTCDQKCLEKELVRKDRYYQAAMDVYKNVSKEYPDSNIWVTGHSLGGALSSLIGRTYGVPAVSFEAPGELLATKRLHLPMPPGLPKYMEGIWHFGHTADPIFMGVCNGASSACSVAGYAMETQCHSGKQCVYDVVTDKGWHVNMLNHRIHTVIDEILEIYNDTAPCIDTPPCRDCFNWNFVANDGKGKDGKKSKTSSIASKTTPTATPTPTKEPKCVEWTWYGRCYEWEDEDGPVDSSNI